MLRRSIETTIGSIDDICIDTNEWEADIPKKVTMSRFTSIRSRRARMSASWFLSRHEHVKEIKATHLVVVLHDCPLSGTSVDPSDEIFQLSSNQHGGVGYWRRSYSDMTLFYRPDRLDISA
jgi:hypothetical protein